MSKTYLDFNTAMQNRFGGKVYRLALRSGATCPNRDGKCGTGGCIFCSKGGSGEFAAGGDILSNQLEEAKKKVESKVKSAKAKGNFAGYVAYFQSFTNTYYRNESELEYFRCLYREAAEHPEIIALSIATRPDCIDEQIISMLYELNQIKPVWVELGLQTSNDKTAEIINRCYETKIYDEAVEKLHKIGIEVITHVMVGLPGEDEEDAKKTVEHVVRLSKPGDGIKISLLYVLKETLLEKIISKSENIIRQYSLEEYGAILKNLISVIPSDMIVHRITGDPPKKDIISPLWTTDKKKVLNYLNKIFEVVK